MSWRRLFAALALSVWLPTLALSQESLQARLDSLETAATAIALKQSDVQISKTDFLHRLIPRVTLSTSFGMHDILFGETPVALVIPKDTYRLTLSLSLDEIVYSSQYEAALLEKEKREVESMAVALKQQEERSRKERRAACLRQELQLFEEELSLFRKISDYYSILFDRGAIKFDAVARSQLQVIGAKQKIGRLLLELQELSVN